MASTLLPLVGMGLALGEAIQTLTYLDDHIAEGWDVPKSVPYREFAGLVRTGDLILTSSTSITSMTRMFTKSLWSHVGMAYVGGDGRLFEWSSHNGSENIDNSAGVVCGGPQLVPMERLAAESGTVFWRPVRMTDAQRDAVPAVVEKFAYRLRFSDNVEFLSYLGWPFSKIFAGYGGGMACPHIVASTYASVGALMLDRDISLYTPESFSDTGDARWIVPVGITSMVMGFDATRLVRLPHLCCKK